VNSWLPQAKCIGDLDEAPNAVSRVFRTLITCENADLHQRFSLFRFQIRCLTAVQYGASMYGRRSAMEETKLTVRVPRDLLENVKRYAAENNTTLTDLIEAYLRRIPSQESLDDAPIVRHLSGILPENISVKHYREHLEEKYGR
jgi:hypothetical protein